MQGQRGGRAGDAAADDQYSHSLGSLFPGWSLTNGMNRSSTISMTRSTGIALYVISISCRIRSNGMARTAGGHAGAGHQACEGGADDGDEADPGDTTIVSVALHTLSAKLDTSVSTIQWVATGYLLLMPLLPGAQRAPATDAGKASAERLASASVEA